MKTTLLLTAFCLATAADPLPGATKPETCPCCATKPAANMTDACCKPEAAATGAFSKASLYQLDTTFTDDSGQTVPFSSLRGRPVVLDLFYASCGYACPLTVTDLLALQARLPAELRRETVFVLVSFDSAHDTAAVLARYRTQRGLDGRWILLRGDDDTVRELAALVGVKYKRETDGAFSHSNLFTVLNREGEIIHQRIGLQDGLDEAAAALGRAK
jgi:protein SCO1/2